MDLPWERLGLGRFAVLSRGSPLLFVRGEPHPRAKVTQAEGIPLVAWGPPEGAGTADAIDLELLARVLVPTLADHTLESLCHRYGISLQSGRECEAIGALFVFLLAQGLSFQPELLSLLSRLLPAATGGLLDRLVPLAVGRPSAAEAPQKRGEAAATSIEEAFSEGGAIAEGLAAFEDRPGQKEMATLVAYTFTGGGALAVEAGPGIGKTFAYLVPAILHLRADRAARLVVSTRTKPLQEQLYNKDLPFLTSRLDPDLAVALLKGRENYACLRRWEVVLGEVLGGLERDLLPSLAPFASWLFRTETGDIEECSAFLADPNSSSLWPRLRDDPQRCLGPMCPFVEDCFSFAARRRAQGASLVVVNHSLLLADRRAGGEILGNYSYLVVDEAHALEGATRQAFTLTLTHASLDALLLEVAPPAGRQSGWIAALAPDEGTFGRVHELVLALRDMNGRLFSTLDRVLPTEVRGRTPPLSGLRAQVEPLGRTLELLRAALEEIAEGLPEPEGRREGERLVAGLDEVTSVLASLFDPGAENTVRWYERTDDGIALHASPIEVAPILAEALFPRLDGIVLTSATLSSNDGFAYLRGALGLDAAPQPLVCAAVESPFSYEEGMRVYLLDFLPPVDGPEEGYADALASLVGAVAKGTGRKVLVLFTSHRLLRAVHDRIAGRHGVLAQGVHGPKSKVIERFRAKKGGTILLGTDSFWEGVDLPGKDLEILIVTRLPFPVPTDPIFAALEERLEGVGKDPFLELSVPQAILKLRQGIGRLIRTRTDRGAVILTDRRILEKSYGSRFAASLPVPGRRVSDLGDLLLDLEDWFRHP
jgi:ATP-dependent DNA helicase DinG